jgi:diguanylate cyclase (GGDEF)-like protein
MTDNPDISNAEEMERLADESGLAIAIVATGARQVTEFNNNSICRSLNPNAEFSAACSRFCGIALEKAREAGKAVGFVCHAGLDCRAFLKDQDSVVIVGRTFLKAENYRKATERAVTGDWQQISSPELFENVLLTGSSEQLDKTARRVREMLERSAVEVAAVNASEPRPATLQPEIRADAHAEIDSDPVSEAADPPNVSGLVSRFNREFGLNVPTGRNRPESKIGEASEWRSFFGSILKTDYAKACSSILEFLAHQYGFSALVWLEWRGSRFESTSVHGEMKGRRIRLGIANDDPRLVAAFHNEDPLLIGERATSDLSNSGRLMNLFPIGVDGEISAAIAILDGLDDEKEKRQIARMCHSIAPQLEILRLRGEVSGRDALANAVRAFSDSLKTIDRDDFWQNVTQNAAEILRAERASLLILDEKSGGFEIKAMIGANSTLPPGVEVGGRVAKTVFERNEPALVGDISSTRLSPAPPGRRYRTNSFLSYPISIGHRTIGVMSFTDRACGKAFDKRSLELFQAIAPQLAVAIDRASLKEKAGEFEQLSVTDALTGLLNRRYIEERLLEEIKRSNRHGFPMSFMMLDVDHFKSYNDEFGHPAGDEALKAVAHVIRETLRGADVAARFGGEEFAILLPQTTGPEAVAIAERIRVNLEQTDFGMRKVTASIGVASCSADLCASDSLIAAADKALYAAKHQGRNRVLAFDELDGA